MRLSLVLAFVFLSTSTAFAQNVTYGKSKQTGPNRNSAMSMAAGQAKTEASSKCRRSGGVPVNYYQGWKTDPGVFPGSCRYHNNGNVTCSARYTMNCIRK